MAMTSSEIVARMCTLQPSECSCERCQEMCTNTPCLGTPEDIFRLVCEGYLDRLAVTIWGAATHIGIPPIPMIQIRSEPCGACPLLEAGRCTVHAIKPTEGRLAFHVPTNFSNAPSLAVAATWCLPRNRKLVLHLFSLFQ